MKLLVRFPKLNKNKRLKLELNYMNSAVYDMIEKSLKKYNLIAYNKLISYYNDLKKGKFHGRIIGCNEEKKRYALKLPTDEIFNKVYGNIEVIYAVYPKEKMLIIEDITPSNIWHEGSDGVLIYYKGVYISKKEVEEDMYKVDFIYEIVNE